MNITKRNSEDSDGDCASADIPEAGKILTDNLLPNKSAVHYKQCYDNFVEWQKQQQTTSVSEETMLLYFDELSKRIKPSTLWSKYSMLKSTVLNSRNVDIGNYSQLSAFLKKNSKGFTSTKFKTLEPKDVEKFLTEAPDKRYLAIKTALIFGITGACRREELKDISVRDIEHYDNMIVVKIPRKKNDVPRKFIIDGEFYKIVRKYEALRPKNTKTDRFFLTLRNGKCTQQVIGVNTFGAMPKLIAEYLGLEQPEKYTGRSFRRTSATMLADAGADLSQLKRHGGWKSNKAVQRCIDDSVALILGITGSCRREELKNITVHDIEHHNKMVVIKIRRTKNHVPRKFTVDGEFYEIFTKYEALRPKNPISDQFFLSFREGRCTQQVIGINSFGAMPKMIAEYLGLAEPEKYTGHSFRRTSATMLAHAGSDITTMKRHEEWKPDQVPRVYVNKKKVCKRPRNSVNPNRRTSINADTNPESPKSIMEDGINIVTFESENTDDEVSDEENSSELSNVQVLGTEEASKNMPSPLMIDVWQLLRSAQKNDCDSGERSDDSSQDVEGSNHIDAILDKLPSSDRPPVSNVMEIKLEPAWHGYEDENVESNNMNNAQKSDENLGRRKKSTFADNDESINVTDKKRMRIETSEDRTHECSGTKNIICKEEIVVDEDMTETSMNPEDISNSENSVDHATWTIEAVQREHKLKLRTLKIELERAELQKQAAINDLVTSEMKKKLAEARTAEYCSQIRMSGEAGSGAGRGGGGGGSIRSAGGSFGKMEAAHEDQYFYNKQKEQLEHLREELHDEISFHEEQIKRHQEAITRHKERIGKMPSE